jgi:hypothetical protein
MSAIRFSHVLIFILLLGLQRHADATDDWTSTSTTNSPSARNLHQAVWTGSVMLVFGGYDRTSYFNDCWSLDPVANNWTQLASAPISGRIGADVVWTGNEMIVWGTSQVDGLTNGARFSPSSNTWTIMNTTNSAVPSDQHTAVWTGTEMFVWGGPNGSARYNPVTDSWTAVSSTNAPTDRGGITPVWTGTEVIIWGGIGTSFFNDGARYNPSTDTWTSMTTVNAPSGRVSYAAVWSGSEFIVWSGNHGATPLQNYADGAHYSPTNDTWTPISTTNVPPGTTEAIAVWSGSEMIVWAGLIGNQPAVTTNAGGRYSLANDTWTSMTQTGVPTVRDRNSAVWTGIAAIIFGGEDGTTSTNTGGMYRPDNTLTYNPVPTLTAISPAQGYVSVFGGNLIATGSNFVSASVVRWNGTALATTFLSSTQLKAEVPASSLTTTGLIPVTVLSPTPIGGLSNSITFTVKTAPTGPQGPAGPQGPQGPAGAQGPAGPQGIQGPAGANGNDGAVGPQGPAGGVGPAGPAGVAGPAGTDGSTGPQGPAGTAGPAGPAGVAGPAGAVGPQGPAGGVGPQGQAGVAGQQGPKGDTGAVGAQGIQGLPGPQGAPVNVPSGTIILLAKGSTPPDGYSFIGSAQIRAKAKKKSHEVVMDMYQKD